MVIQKFLYNKHFDNDIQKKEWNPRKASQYSIDIYSILAFDLEQKRKKENTFKGWEEYHSFYGPCWEKAVSQDSPYHFMSGLLS